MAAQSEFAKTFNSFSGVDIKAVFSNEVIGEIQAISYSVTREKAPLYTMGSADPRSFSRGKRGIAGTMIFLIFDRHPLLGTFGIDAPASGKTPLYFWSDKDDVRPGAAADGNINSTGVSEALDGNIDTVANAESNISNIGSDQEAAAPWYADQIPPFDITLAAANEYGALAVMRVFGCEILNEGYGVSIDDIVSEQQMTYVARTLTGWRHIANPTAALPSDA